MSTLYSHNYVVTLPDMLKKVYLGITCFSLCFFLFFELQYMRGIESVTIGHPILFAILTVISLFVTIFTNKWKLKVNGTTITISKLFRKTITMDFTEIDDIKIGKKSEIKFYKNNRKIVTIDLLCDNYEELAKDLHRYNNLEPIFQDK